LDSEKTENISWRYLEKDPQLFDQISRWRKDLFFRRLNLPAKLFVGASVLSLGSGSGEYEIFYPMWGCNEYTCIEPNPTIMDRIKFLFNHYDLNSAIKETHVASCLDVDLGDKVFDFIIADGSFFHVANPLDAMAKFLPHVAKDGFFVLGLPEMSGGFQRNLQRFILYNLAGNDPDEISGYAHKIFADHLERAARFGKRTKEAVIYDAYVNPKIKTPTILEELDVVAQSGLHVYSTYPSIQPFALTGSFREEVTPLEQKQWHHLLLPNQLTWLLAKHGDKEVLDGDFQAWAEASELFNGFISAFADVTPDNADLELLEQAINLLDGCITKDFTHSLEQFLAKRLVEFRNDLVALNIALAKKDIDRIKPESYERLFSGTCGVGHMYLVACRF
jgi:SAM-dependent methyltransferase